MENINFWDFGPIWSLVLLLAILFSAMLLANLLRRLIKPIRNSLIPSSVLGGFILLFADYIFRLCTSSEGVLGDSFFKLLSMNVTLEALTYHCLGLGFVATSLKTAEKQASGKQANADILNTGVTTVSTYLLQGIIGILVVLGLVYTVYPDLFKAAGLLLPMGYGQGPGQALNFGTIFAGKGFENGASFGLTIAAMGFVSASIGGVIYLNALKRKGKIKVVSSQEANEKVQIEQVIGKEDIPLSESMDKLTIQIGLVLFAYIVAFLFMYLISIPMDKAGGFWANTVKPLIWGFNFLVGTVFAILLKMVLKKLKKHKIIKRDYLNNFMLSRVAGVFFDIMVVASIAAINLDAFAKAGFIVPLILLCVIGAIATYYYVKWISNKLFPDYEAEAFLSMYGMLTGTASTGVILMREIDPQFETPAANNLVYQNLPAILFGFPMLLLMGYAPNGDKNIWITLAALVVMLAFMLVILFRKYIFKKKKPKNIENNN